jgi:hypothetical protein
VTEPSERVVCRALGDELRRTREEKGLTRREVVERLPSGICDRTLLSYEHGTRHVTTIRWIELSRAIGIDPALLMTRGLQRARLYMRDRCLTIDLRALLRDGSPNFRPIVQWARNTLNEHPGGTAEVEPAVVRNLALFMGCTHAELARYLARFLPDNPEQSVGN